MKEINRRFNKGLEPFDEGIKITLSEKQISKLVIFCIQYKDNLLEASRSFKELSKEYEKDEEKHNIFKDNSEYYKEMYNIIHEIREYIDNFVSFI